MGKSLYMAKHFYTVECDISRKNAASKKTCCLNKK